MYECQQSLTGNLEIRHYGNPRYGEDSYKYLPSVGGQGIYDPEWGELEKDIRDGKQGGWKVSHKKMTRDGHELSEFYKVSRGADGHRQG